MEDKVQPQSWRDSAADADESERWTPQERRKFKILGQNPHYTYSRELRLVKDEMLRDLKMTFAKDHRGVHKFTHLNTYKRKVKPRTSTKLQNAASLMIQDQDNEISELVTAIQSPQFKINEKGNLNKTNGLFNASKTETVTNKSLVKNGHVHCDSHHVNGGVNHTVPHLEMSEQTITMDH